MKRILLVAACAWLAGCAPDNSALKPQDATAFFKPDFDKIYAAWSTLDTAKVAPYYAKDPKLVFYDVTPMQYIGWEDYAAGFKRASADWKSAQATVGSDFHATQLGNVAYVRYSLEMTIEHKNGDTEKMLARATDVLEKRGDQWLIVQEHVSVPLASGQTQEQPKAKAHKAKTSSHAKTHKKRR